MKKEKQKDTGKPQNKEKSIGELKRKKEITAGILIGIPVWVLNILMLVLSGYPGIMFDLVILIFLYYIFLHKKKSHRIIHSIKIGAIFLTISLSAFLATVPDPSFWDDYYTHETDVSKLITPQDEYVQKVKEDFEDWLDGHPPINGTNSTKYSTYYNDGKLKNWIYSWQYYQYDAVNWTEMDELEKAMVIDFYVRRYIVNWTSDSEVYGISDYKASPHEILSQMANNGWTKPAQDDCDGQAAVTVSLMKSFGLNAYIGDGKGHWFTVVNVSTNSREEYGLENVVMLNFWQSVHLWSYFDEDEFYISQSPAMTFLELIFMEDEDPYQPFYSFADEYPEALYIINIFAAILVALLIGYPRGYEGETYARETKKREERKNKLTKALPFLNQKWNPLTWILYPLFYFTYIRTGNPFRKVYKRSWFNIILAFVLIVIPVQWLLGNQGNLTMHTYLYLNVYILFAALFIERDISGKIFDHYGEKLASFFSRSNHFF